MEQIKEKGYTKNEIISAYKEVQNLLDSEAITVHEFNTYSGISHHYIYKLFGSWSNLKKKMDAPVTYRYRPQTTKKEVINKAFSLYKKHGKLTTRIMYKEGYAQNIVNEHFGTFSLMLKELDIRPTNSAKSKTIPKETYLANLVFLEDIHGYINSTLLNRQSNFRAGSYNYLFGTVGEACLVGRVRHLGQISINQPNSQAMKVIKETGRLLKDHYFHTELSFNWLTAIDSNHALPVDAYFPYQNLILEFHGPQHYQEDHWLYQKKYSGHRTLAEQKAQDIHKKEMILENGYRYVEVYDYEIDNLPWILKHRIEQPRF